MLTEIEKISNPSRDLFSAGFFNIKKPIIILGQSAQLGQIIQWDAEYLTKKLGDKKIPISQATSSGIYTLDPKHGKHVLPQRNMLFKDFIKKVQIQKDNKVYLQHTSLFTTFPELLPDIKYPYFIDSSRIFAINMWVGGENSTTSLHQDYPNNFIIQIYGTKKFTLFSPNDRKYLYPFGWDTRTPQVSKLDINNVDLRQYPLFNKARPIEVELNPGEILFLPSCWWHQVQNKSFSIAINIWCFPYFSQCFFITGWNKLLRWWWLNKKNYHDTIIN